MRVHFHEELERLELDVLGMGELAEHAVERAVQALTQDDLALMQAVVGDDGENPYRAFADLGRANADGVDEDLARLKRFQDRLGHGRADGILRAGEQDS